MREIDKIEVQGRMVFLSEILLSSSPQKRWIIDTEGDHIEIFADIDKIRLFWASILAASTVNKPILQMTVEDIKNEMEAHRPRAYDLILP